MFSMFKFKYPMKYSLNLKNYAFLIRQIFRNKAKLSGPKNGDYFSKFNCKIIS